jgi:hypothetical protein
VAQSIENFEDVKRDYTLADFSEVGACGIGVRSMVGHGGHGQLRVGDRL